MVRFSLNIGSELWDVLVVPDDDPTLDGGRGITDTALRKIYVGEHAGPSVLFHELAHASLAESGAQYLLRRLLCIEEGDDWENAEEDIVTVFAQTWFDTLTRNGFLTLPPLNILSS